MLKGQFEITKAVYESESFCIYGAIPLGDIVNDVELNKYGNISLKTDGIHFIPKHIYTLAITPTESKYGLQYIVEETGFDFKDIKDITPELNLELLYELTTTQLAQNIHEAYPNFIELVLTNNIDKIDIKNIYGVGDKLLNKYIKKVNESCAMYVLRANFPQYKLTANETKSLLSRLDTVDSVKELLADNPYVALIEYCDRSFFSVDKMLIDKYRTTDIRIAYLIDAIIREHEYEGSTYVDAVNLANEVMNYDSEVVPKLKEVAEKAENIIYNNELNILQRKITYQQELKIARFIRNKIKTSEPKSWSWKKFTKIKDGELTNEQQQILETICKSNVSCLVGYSGSGKSATVMAILQMLEAYDQSYIMLSPTGKAAMRLKEQTGRQAYTIHKATMQGDIFEDWIIIDEMSMVSNDLISMVIQADTNPNTRYLFVGDSAQLPSIGLGKILGDMIQSKTVPTVFLTHIFRFNEGGASYVSTLSRKGEQYLKSNENITLGKNKDYSFIQWDGTIEHILDTYKNLIEQGINKKDICILSPQNVGAFGTLTINNLIQSYINPISLEEKKITTTINNIKINFHKNDLVIITKNNYQTPTIDDFGDISDDNVTATFNGQIGTILYVDINNNGLVVDVEGEKVFLDRDTVSTLRLAYCITVHKMQGSSCKHIINIVIPQHTHMLSKELLYTAQTRLEQNLYEIGTKEAIDYALQTKAEDNKRTRLLEFLKKEEIVLD